MPDDAARSFKPIQAFGDTRMISRYWKLALLLLLVAWSAYELFPSVQYYTMSEADRKAMPPDKLQSLKDKAIKLGLDLQGGMHLVLEVDKSKLSAADSKDAIDRALQILRSRVDQFGVAEPLVQKQGQDRIVVQLPGLLDEKRAKDLIGQVGLLEFKIVKTEDEAREAFQRVDNWYARTHPPSGTSRTDSSLALHPFTGRFASSAGPEAFVSNEDTSAVRAILRAVPDSVLPPNTEIVEGAVEETQPGGGRLGRAYYVLNKTAEMTGNAISTASMRPGIDPQRPGAPGVSVQMTGRGTAQFARVTRANVQRRMAIVLDGRVYSAPVIQEPIPSGQASISGNFTDRSATDLAIVLKAGALPAPVRIIEERTVGPTLGRDSIHAGLTASLLGAALVVLFMLVYYRGSGIVAIFTLVLNILLLLAAMAAIHSTLTLPGIAGVALTIGMAVDANVLIFERIREELRNQRSVRTAIDLGFKRAWRTILDANMTTLISTVVLMVIGTGTVKGFGVTLTIGLIANIYTAVLVARMVFDWIAARRHLETLSI
jgi:protein-export membrane protein SecD